MGRKTKAAIAATIGAAGIVALAALAAAEFRAPAYVGETMAAAADRVFVAGGTSRIGSTRGAPDEQPVFAAEVEPFWLDRSPVTVGAFAAFVERTGYRTEAERFGDAGVLDIETGAWRLVKGVNWRRPLGPDAPPALADHPVTQVSWNDAVAYCTAMDGRLPTEVEWEHAARWGQEGEVRYAFGGRLVQEGEYYANIWTGIFPVLNTGEDGFIHTSPVGHYGETPLGLTDMAGNVWEWVADWYRPYADREKSVSRAAQSEKVQRGGSFLCDPKVCHGFRVSARSRSTPDTALMHVGFRCASDAG